MSETGPFGTMTSQYDLLGRRTRLTWADGFRADWTLNPYGQAVLGTATPLNGATGTVASWSYDAMGRPGYVTRGNGVVTAWGYDAVGRLSSLQHVGAGAGDVIFAYGHNPAGQIVSRSMANANYEVGRTFSYTGYTVDRLNRVTSVGGSGVGYDLRQNITALPGRSFSFDAESRLTGAGGHGFGDDPAGRVLYATGPQASWFVHDDQQLVAEYTPGPLTVRNRHVPAGLNEITVTYDSATLANAVWPLHDERGSVIALTDANGTPGHYTVYDEYGVTLSGGTGTRFGYTGQANILSDLQDNHARNLTLSVGRFNQPDPLGYAAGVNLYGYVGADPVNWVDPLGSLPSSNENTYGGGYDFCVSVELASGRFGKDPSPDCRFVPGPAVSFGGGGPGGTGNPSGGGGGGSRSTRASLEAAASEGLNLELYRGVRCSLLQRRLLNDRRYIANALTAWRRSGAATLPPAGRRENGFYTYVLGDQLVFDWEPPGLLLDMPGAMLRMPGRFQAVWTHIHTLGRAEGGRLFPSTNDSSFLNRNDRDRGPTSGITISPEGVFCQS